MKLLIDEPITWTETYGPSITEEDREDQETYVAEVCEFLHNFRVWHYVNLMESGFSVTLQVQKCTLAEKDMNELFYEVLRHHFGVGWLKYSPLGGAGCDFAVRIGRNSVTGLRRVKPLPSGGGM